MVYSLHGVFTPVSEHHLWLFLMYGPASRLLMSACLLLAFLKFGQTPDSAAQRGNFGHWMAWFAFLLLINVAVALLAETAAAGMPWLRKGQETAALLLCLGALAVLARRPFGAYIKRIYSIALTWFAIASIAFLLSSPWSHLWWLAHAIFAGGFTILGYAVLRAYANEEALEQVFTEWELSDDLARSKSDLAQAQAATARAELSLAQQNQRAQQAENQFAALLDVSPDAIVTVDPAGLIVQANGAAEQAFGYDPGQMLGLRVEQLLPDKLRHSHTRLRSLFVYSPTSRPMKELRAPLICQRKDGSTMRATISLAPLAVDGQPCVVAFIRAVQQPQAIALSSPADRWHSDAYLSFAGKALAALPLAALLFKRCTDGSYVMTQANPCVLQLLGCSPESADENLAGLWFKHVHPDDLPELIARIETASAESTDWQASWRAKLAQRDMQRYHIQTGLPNREPDGSLSWVAFFRCVEERAGDVAVPLPRISY